MFLNNVYNLTSTYFNSSSLVRSSSFVCISGLRSFAANSSITVKGGIGNLVHTNLLQANDSLSLTMTKQSQDTMTFTCKDLLATISTNFSVSATETLGGTVCMHSVGQGILSVSPSIQSAGRLISENVRLTWRQVSISGTIVGRFAVGVLNSLPSISTLLQITNASYRITSLVLTSANLYTATTFGTSINSVVISNLVSDQTFVPGI